MADVPPRVAPPAGHPHLHNFFYRVARAEHCVTTAIYSVVAFITNRQSTVPNADRIAVVMATDPYRARPAWRAALSRRTSVTGGRQPAPARDRRVSAVFADAR
jgi:hypothetical protein